MSRGSDSAARLDAAIDALLDGQAPLASVGDARDLELLTTARLLHVALPRFHPRFGFEEQLARRFSEAGNEMGRGAEHAPAEPPPVVRPRATTAVPVDPSTGVEALRHRDGSRRRGLLAGGAIASGLSLAIPIAGAALAVWRRSRAGGLS
jgi:hypothetical protein